MPTAKIIAIASHETQNIMDQDVLNVKKTNKNKTAMGLSHQVLYRWVNMNHKSRNKINKRRRAREYSRYRNKLVINQSLKKVKQIFIRY